MMAGVLLKVTGIWLVMVVAAILNGLLRDALLTPLMGRALSLPLSGIMLSGLVLVVAYALIPFIGVMRTGGYLMTGLFWVALTLTFEYVFGHYVAGKSWHEINEIFNLANGDLFILVIIVTVLSPWLAARFRGLV